MVVTLPQDSGSNGAHQYLVQSDQHNHTDCTCIGIGCKGQKQAGNNDKNTCQVIGPLLAVYLCLDHCSIIMIIEKFILGYSVLQLEIMYDQSPTRTMTIFYAKIAHLQL